MPKSLAENLSEGSISHQINFKFDSIRNLVEDLGGLFVIAKMSFIRDHQWRTQELSMGGVFKLKLDIMTSYSYLCKDIKIQTEYFNIESLC